MEWFLWACANLIPVDPVLQFMITGTVGSLIGIALKRLWKR